MWMQNATTLMSVRVIMYLRNSQKVASCAKEADANVASLKPKVSTILEHLGVSAHHRTTSLDHTIAPTGNLSTDSMFAKMMIKKRCRPTSLFGIIQERNQCKITGVENVEFDLGDFGISQISVIADKSYHSKRS